MAGGCAFFSLHSVSTKSLSKKRSAEAIHEEHTFTASPVDSQGNYYSCGECKTSCWWSGEVSSHRCRWPHGLPWPDQTQENFCFINGLKCNTISRYPICSFMKFRCELSLYKILWAHFVHVCSGKWFCHGIFCFLDGMLKVKASNCCYDFWSHDWWCGWCIPIRISMLMIFFFFSDSCVCMWNLKFILYMWNMKHCSDSCVIFQCTMWMAIYI